MDRQNRATTQIERNISVHDRVAGRYERLHGEIFNDVEQARLRDLLKRAIGLLGNGDKRVKALDMGSGSGNLTGHLLELGAEVTAADVSGAFLKLVEDRYAGLPLTTHRLNGRDLAEIADGAFDLVATYSVLHHIPDYLAACAEMARVCRKGGVVVIDHEASPNVWTGDPALHQFRREAPRFDWRKYATPANYFHRVRRLLDPRYSNEGDIHVWPDDHVEWDKIIEVMARNGAKAVLEEDYLLYRKIYRRDVYDRFKNHCVDTRAMVFRREPA
jgi:ubiquinone/menaquinone biosynthesis C-methylase UbiE